MFNSNRSRKPTARLPKAQDNFKFLTDFTLLNKDLLPRGTPTCDRGIEKLESGQVNQQGGRGTAGGKSLGTVLDHLPRRNERNKFKLMQRKLKSLQLGDMMSPRCQIYARANRSGTIFPKKR